MYAIVRTFHEAREQGGISQLYIACFPEKAPTWSKPPTLMGTGASRAVFVADASGVLRCWAFLYDGILSMFS